MKLSEIVSQLVEDLKTIEDIKHVDLYFSQDESEVRTITNFPALLVGLSLVDHVEKAVTYYDETPNLSALLFVDSRLSNTDKELATIDLIGEVESKIINAQGYNFKLTRTSCVERSARMTVYLIEFQWRGGNYER